MKQLEDAILIFGIEFDEMANSFLGITPHELKVCFFNLLKLFLNILNIITRRIKS